MQTPARILRADAESLERDSPDLTVREQEQYTRILTIAEGLMARHGIHTMTASSLAQALRMAPSTLRRHFADLDALLATLLHRHLRKLAGALNKIPQDSPDRPQKCRAAYLAYTRTPQGGFTEAHLLLVRDRHLLPDDLLTNIEAARCKLGNLLAQGHAEEALALLDLPSLNAPRIEAALAAITADQQKPAPPAPKPAPHRDRIIPAARPRDALALLRFGPLPIPPHVTARPQIHSSA